MPMFTRKLTPEARKIRDAARAWARSPAGQASALRAVEVAKKTVEQMEEAERAGRAELALLDMIFGCT